MVTPSGKLVPWASGLRTPNGLGFDLDGNLFVCDNQGDWLGTARCIASNGESSTMRRQLALGKRLEGGRPVDLPSPELEKRRETAAVYFHGIMANSPSQPLVDSTRGAWFCGQLFVGEMNKGRILRTILEKIGGKVQRPVFLF